MSRISGNALAIRDRLKSEKIPSPTTPSKQGSAFLCCCCCYAFTTFALNKGVGFSSNYSSMTTPTSGGKQLKDVWAGAYEAWIDCPESREKVLYMKPTLNYNTNTNTRRSNSDDDAFQFPSWLQRKQVFALTAHNPRGVEVDRARNDRANEKLEEKIKTLIASRGSQGKDQAMYWPSFGFSSEDDWREDGYAVAFSDVDATAESDVVRLAKEFEQGAIYKYRWINDEKRMERKTVGALMMETEETVIVEVCEKPVGVKLADVAI